MDEQSNARKPASRHHPYVEGYAPEDLMGVPKTTFHHHHRAEKKAGGGGPCHDLVQRALEIRDDAKAGKPLPPLPSKATPEPVISEPEPEPPARPEPVEEPIVVVTMRTPKSLHDRFRDFAHVSRKTKQSILVEALRRYLDEEERKAAR